MGLWERILPETTEDVESQYTFGEEIGSGGSGVVRVCHHKITGERFACKTIQKCILHLPETVEDVRREVAIMWALSQAPHPHVVQLKGAYEDSTSIHLVMEHCAGGELFGELVRRGPFGEPEAASVFRQIVEAVAFCHSKGVVHRDLKPENVLLMDPPAQSWERADDSRGDPAGRVRGVAGNPPDSPYARTSQGSGSMCRPMTVGQVAEEMRKCDSLPVTWEISGTKEEVWDEARGRLGNSRQHQCLNAGWSGRAGSLREDPVDSEGGRSSGGQRQDGDVWDGDLRWEERRFGAGAESVPGLDSLRVAGSDCRPGRGAAGTGQRLDEAEAAQSGLRVKLGDFGLAVCLATHPGSPRPPSSTVQCPTPLYSAPELVAGKAYGTPADVWSLGVILYALLGGELPFTGATQRELGRAIRRGRLNLGREPWPSISASAKGLIRRLLETDSQRRPLAREVLSHPWVVSGGVVPGSTATSRFERCRSLPGVSPPSRTVRHLELALSHIRAPSSCPSSPRESPRPRGSRPLRSPLSPSPRSDICASSPDTNPPTPPKLSNISFAGKAKARFLRASRDATPASVLSPPSRSVPNAPDGRPCPASVSSPPSQQQSGFSGPALSSLPSAPQPEATEGEGRHGEVSAGANTRGADLMEPAPDTPCTCNAPSLASPLGSNSNSPTWGSISLQSACSTSAPHLPAWNTSIPGPSLLSKPHFGAAEPAREPSSERRPLPSTPLSPLSCGEAPMSGKRAWGPPAVNLHGSAGAPLACGPGSGQFCREDSCRMRSGGSQSSPTLSSTSGESLWGTTTSGAEESDLTAGSDCDSASGSGEVSSSWEDPGLRSAPASCGSCGPSRPSHPHGRPSPHRTSSGQSVEGREVPRPASPRHRRSAFEASPGGAGAEQGVSFPAPAEASVKQRLAGRAGAYLSALAGNAPFVTAWTARHPAKQSLWGQLSSRREEDLGQGSLGQPHCVRCPAAEGEVEDTASSVQGEGGRAAGDSPGKPGLVRQMHLWRERFR